MSTYTRRIDTPLIGIAPFAKPTVSPKRVLRGWMLVAWIFVGSLSLTMSAIRLGSLRPQMTVVNPPPQYLPGSPIISLSQELRCSPSRHDMYDLRVPCMFDYVGNTIVLNFSAANGQIIHTSMWNREYRVGDMIVAWGYPTSIVQSGNLAYLYWGSRAVFLRGRILRPTGFVSMIEYFMDPQHGTRWRGFTNKSH
jgi:hypothetical protein